MSKPGDVITAKEAIVKYRESSPPQIPKSAPTPAYEWVIFKHNVRIRTVRPYGETD